MIYTSYFANIKKMPANIVPISICGRAPDGYHGLQYRKLAPKFWFFKKWKLDQDCDFYITQFRQEVLKPVRSDVVEQELYSLAKSQDIVLICYEKPTDFCHRHIVRQWLNDNGIKCEEYHSESNSG